MRSVRLTETSQILHFEYTLDIQIVAHFTVLSVPAWFESEAGVDLVLMETSLLFLCK